jgi:hypothetical protein
VRKFYVFTMAIALMAPLAVLNAGPSGAAAAKGTTCSGQTGTATIKPGLSNTARTVTITAKTTLTKCTGTVKSGTGVASIVMKGANCAGLAKTGGKSNISEKITWNTKTTSTFKGTSKTGPKVGQATITGSISAGTFKGLKVSTIIAFVPKAGQGCAGKGIQNLTIKSVAGKPFAVK